MNCGLCNSSNVEIIYKGYIRDGKAGNYYKDEVPIYCCCDCKTIWHEELGDDYQSYYESEDYRRNVDGTSEIGDFYRMHDAENLEKFRYTGTQIFRDKVVSDIGCGGGGFLDYIYTVAGNVIAVEPSSTYRRELEKKGFTVFPYASDALEKFKDEVDVLVSFDVIEHVKDPVRFVEEAYSLLSKGGYGFIGTPTDAPVMRELLGADYESFLFSTQHPWIFGERSFHVIAQKCGIESYSCKFYQRYGLGNLIYWMQNKKPGQHKKYDFVSKGLDEHWKADLEARGLSDYIVFEFSK